MTLKFLQTTPSANPHYPFQAGQLLEATKLSAEMRQWISQGLAVLLKDEPERAVADVIETRKGRR